MGRRSSARALCASWLIVTALLAGTAGESFASGARARWRPSADPRVAGYRLYVRGVRTAYGAPIDVGLPKSGTDGTLAAVIDGLNLARTYHLAVAAYTEDGAESALSGELALGPLNPCVVDHCDGVADCKFAFIPDGTWCTVDGEQDPCTAVAVCTAGTCAPSAHGAGRLASARVRISVRRREGRLTVHGTFPAAGDFDPTTTGATLELADESGALLYRATVPGEQFDAVRQDTAFRYLATRREARENNGLRVLDAFVSDRDVVTTARAESVQLREVLGSPALRVTLRFGNTCARDLGLTCRSPVTGGLTCR